ncbi:MAG: RdgB/HAM1 family non-canonical purine NTP pyrophosphatase [bacterium]|nr:RdgB/HAM1 family non-canonical purine NTP pyrophosphatase [bacterium]
MKIVLATSNPHKVKEINEITTQFCVDNNINLTESINFILPPTDFNPDETGETFAENSYIKAKEGWNLSRNWCLADDSGLCIEALNGKPGIYSARYAETPQKRIERVLKELKGIENRKAHFVCHMTLINPDGEIAFSYEGICKGSIINEPKGVNGFGYDPIFLPEGYSKTIAELSEDEKNQISHRSIALREVIKYLTSFNRQV